MQLSRLSHEALVQQGLHQVPHLLLVLRGDLGLLPEEIENVGLLERRPLLDVSFLPQLLFLLLLNGALSLRLFGRL